jgi:integrase
MHKPLSAASVARLKKPGRYAVGDGAYLQVSKWRTKSWVFRYERLGRAHHVGLGPYSLVTLAEARRRAHDARRLLLDGIDPLGAKRAAKRERWLAHMHSKTFKECAEQYIADHEAGWRGDRSRHQWTTSLAKYAYPKIGDLRVADVDLACVLSIIEPIWRTVPETAARVRNRIELVLDWATARKLRAGENPARWKGHLESLLPARRAVRRVQHFAAMNYADIGRFMQQLRAQTAIAAGGLEFLILTAARPGEVLGARWNEVEGAVWKIPAERTKAHREHRIPLSDRAVELLASLPRIDKNEFVFAGRGGAQQSPAALVRVLRRLGYDDLVAHGFRSTFRDWAAETTAYPNHVVEQALSHVIGNSAEAAYRRGDLLEKRRRLMQDWADFCASPARAGEAVTLRGAS